MPFFVLLSGILIVLFSRLISSILMFNSPNIRKPVLLNTFSSLVTKSTLSLNKKRGAFAPLFFVLYDSRYDILSNAVNDVNTDGVSGLFV